ncbi:MAG: carbohydrate-binding family 9-like protein [Candidatus Aminicenantales bacterium]
MQKPIFVALALTVLVPALFLSLAGDTTRMTEPKIPFEPQTAICYRAAGPVTVDGNLDEAVWDKVSWSDPFADIEGRPRVKPRFKTMVKLLWDDTYFYVGAYLEETNVWATLTERDSVIFQDNDFELFIDPDGDSHNYFELEINALNTVWDLFLINPYRDGRPANIDAWDIRGLKSAVLINGTINNPGDKDKSWFVELALPWAVLQEAADPSAPPRSGDQWRINFSRVEYRTTVVDGAVLKATDPSSGRPYPEDNWVWSPMGLINIHYPEMWGYVQFSGKTAGKGRDSFVDRPEEKAKWLLRRVYYREWAWRAEKGTFTSDLKTLGFKEKELKVSGFSSPPVLQAIDRMFEASLTATDGSVWRIRQDGRVGKDR